jgi:hypothetical protein
MSFAERRKHATKLFDFLIKLFDSLMNNSRSAPVPCRNFVSLAKRLRRCVCYLTDILGISLSLDPLPRRNKSLIRGTNVPALGTEHGGHHHD